VLVENVGAWFDKHRHDKNYQYRDMSEEEFDKRAAQSFLRLTPEQQTKVLTVCLSKGIGQEKDIYRFRFLAQTNLFALCKLLEKYKDMIDHEYLWTDGNLHNTHEEICNEFFVRKDPTKKTFKEFSSKENYTEAKERLLLVPRGGFKSSMNMADCVQWIICFPEITILVLTGVLDLAKDFVGEIKGHFKLEDGGINGLFIKKKSLKPRTMLDGTDSMFQVLFPEHCIAEDDGKSYKYQTPAVSMTEKECTVFAASIEQNLAGWHVCIMKLDDVVTNENSQTVDRIININKQVSINAAMLHPYGFYDKIGTWYDSQDTYGQDIINRKKFVEEGGSEAQFPMKIYIRPAWWQNATARALGKVDTEMTESDYDYWFNVPENEHSLTFKFLQHKKKTDPWFAIKYLNDPTQMHIIKFPRELLVRRTVPAAMLPNTGMIVTCVDTAYSTKSWADYTVILTALIYGGRFYIIDMKRGRYNEFELPALIAATALQWKPRRMCIEESVGVKWMGREAYREMDKLKIRVPIEWVSLGQGKKTKSKSEKAGPVLRYLGEGKLLFLNSCPSLDELYDELSKFGTAAALHDDIVDVLAILVNQFCAYAENEAKVSAAQDAYYDPKQQAAYNQVFNGKAVDQSHMAALESAFPSTNGEAVTGAGLGSDYCDPLSDAGIFG
jgi:phage terminase large subunit-like protein